MIKYKTSNYGVEIERVEVIRETAQCVFVVASGRERRESKSSEWSKYHDTWQQAKDFLVERETVRVEAARRILELAKGKLGNAKGLREPK